LAAEGIDPSGRRVLILGSGGAARAIAFTLATIEPLPHLEILGVVAEELTRLGTDLRGKTPMAVSTRPLDDRTLADALASAELVIHATPIGMTPKTEASIVPADQIRPAHVVFDIVYTPRATRLLRDAEAAGAQTVPGIGMFVHQAAIQFEMWTGREAPLDVMLQTVTDALEEGA
jgi:shikimate dehydrogenase